MTSIYSLFVVLIVLAALLMIGIVLIQESKGGGFGRRLRIKQCHHGCSARPLMSLKRPHGHLLPPW